MCDCFHLAFPNWHAPAAGAGRRLRGPEQEAEDSVCEEPEILEQERPRPQGSSPVEEFPVEKQAEEDITDSHKSGSNKKSRKSGLGSLFDKRVSDKMNEAENIQSGESEIIVKTVREACVEGLIVTGGGKEGIFIKEVKVDSPASKHLSMKEGDQILSATVYFDNVTYEDALQILEHAQPYKMEFCLKRKAEPTMLKIEKAEIIHPKEKDQVSPVMRNERKMKKQQERISWPKFPSFGKGPRVQFRRSHSTSEAEEHRKLEMSPPTSDTDSPLKSPLKCPEGKDKKKKHKVQLKMKMKGYRSKSVEEPQRNEVLVWENQQVEDIIEEKFSEGHEEKMQKIPQVLDGAEYETTSKTGDDDPFDSLSGMGLHEVHLISLGNTLKTTDISLALAEGGKIESSEMEVGINQNDKPDIGTESRQTVKSLYTISDPSACDNVVLSQAEVEISNLDRDMQGIGKDSSEKKLDSGNAELSITDLDTCVEVTKKSPNIGTEKQWNEISAFEHESYGIRTRGPLADIAISKTHFVSPVNGLQFISPDFSEITQKMFDGISDAANPTVILQPKPGSTVYAVDKEDSPLKIKSSKLPTETTDLIQADLDKRSAAKLKLPKVDGSGFVTHELIKMTEMEKIRSHLPKREDIEIPGMENKETKPSLQPPDIKVPKIEKIINITKEREIQKVQTDEEFNVEDVKVAVSKFPAFKLPEGDITGVLVQREITIMEQKSDKSMLTPRGSPHKISITSTDSSMSIPKSKVGEEKSPASDAVDKDTANKMPKVELPYIDEQTLLAMIKIDCTKPQITDNERLAEINFRLPKREDIEIPGMEAIKESKLQNKGVSGTDIDHAEIPKTKKYSDKKGHEKKSKKPKITTQGSEIAKLDIQSSDRSVKLLKKDTGETNIHEGHKFKTPKIREGENIDVLVQETKILEDNMDKMNLPQKTETKFSKTKFKVPSITLPEFATKVPVETLDVSAVDVQGKEPGIISPETRLSPEPLASDLDATDVNKDGHSVPVYGRAQESDTEGQGRKFKLPKFELSFPEVKPPKIICTSKKDDDSSMSEETGEVSVMHSPKAQPAYVKPEVSTHLPEIDSEITELKIKRPGFSFPRFGLSKSDNLVPAADVSLTKVNMPLPEGHTEMEDPDRTLAISVNDGKQKDTTKFGSPTKFKIPSIKFPNFGPKITKSNVCGDVNDAEIILPDTKLKASAEPIVKEPDVNNEKSLSMSIVSEAHGSKFKLPKFGISLPEVKRTKIDISSDQTETDISVPIVKGPKLDKTEIDIVVPKATVEVHPSDVKVQDVTSEIKADLPDVDSKDIKMKMETPGFSFPESRFSKAKVQAAEGDANPPNISVALPEREIEIERPDTNVTVSVDSPIQKDPTKFKLPSFTFPKFGSKTRKASVEVSDVDVEVKGPEIHILDTKIHVIAEPLTVDKVPDAEKETNSLSSEMKDQGGKFKFPKLGISLSEVKGPKIGVSLEKAVIDMSEPQEKVYIHPPDVEVQDVTGEIKADLPEIESSDTEMKIKSPGFSFPKLGLSQSELKAPKSQVSLRNADVSLPEGSVEIEIPATEVSIPVKDAEPKGHSKFGSSTKFELPSFNLPKFGLKGPKASGEVSDEDVDVKGPEIKLLDAEIKLSAEPLTVDIKGPDTDKEIKPSNLMIGNMEMKDQDIQSREHGSKFKLPKFGFSLPETKGPKFDVGPDIDISVPKAKLEMQPPEVEVQVLTTKIKADLTNMDSEETEIRIKAPGISFPKIGFIKSEDKVPDCEVSLPNVDMSLPEGNVEIEKAATDFTVPMEDEQQKSRSKFGSPTKFKLPSFSLPKFGIKGPKPPGEVPDEDVDVKGPEIKLPDAEMKLSAEPLTVDIKEPDTDKEIKLPNLEMKDQDIQSREHGSKFKLPKFGFGFHEIKGPKFDVSSDKAEIDISVPKAKLELQPPEVEVQGLTTEIKADLTEMDSEETEMKIKAPGFSFPKIGFVKSEDKVPECEVSLPNVDMSLPERNVEIEKTATDVTVLMEDEQQKGRPKFGSPTKFKLPSFSLPKFGLKGSKTSVEVSDVDVNLKGPEISLPDAELKLSAEPLIAHIKEPDGDKEMKTLSLEMKDQYIQFKEQESTFKLPQFEIGLPETKEPKFDSSSDKTGVEIFVPTVKPEVHPPEVEVQGVTSEIKANLSDIDCKDTEMKVKTPGFSFPRIGFNKSEVRASEGEVSSPNVDASLPEGIVEKTATDVSIPKKDAKQKGQSMFDSPTKFELPSINFPRFGIKGPKASVEASDVDVDVKEPEISLPDAKIKFLAEPLTVDIIGPDTDKKMKPPSLEMKDQDIQIREQGSKFKLPKIDIGLPEIKGPTFDVISDQAKIDISVPEAMVDLHPPDVAVEGVTAETNADLPDMDSKDTEMKIKTPGFSFPGIGLGKSRVKAPEGSVSFPNVDLSLPERSVKIQKPATDLTITMEHAEQKGQSKFDSPTKFELPSITLPKFGLKGPKASAEVSDVDLDAKGPEIKLLDAEIKLPAEPLTVDIKEPDTDTEIKPPSLEMKDQDIQSREHGSKFKLPKFGIGLPEIKGPKFDVSSDKAEIDISVPKAKLEIQAPEVEVQGLTTEIKADVTDMDSEETEIKIKAPGFSFPKIGFVKSEDNIPECEVSLPNVDMSLLERNVEIEKAATDVTVPIEDEPKGRTNFGSPTKFKLPSFNLPKFGLKGSKASVEVSCVEENVKGPEISLPNAEINSSAEPLTVDIKEPDADKEIKPPSLEKKNQDIQIREHGSKFKLPKFDIGLPEIKGPKFDASSKKAQIDISIPKAIGDVHLLEVEEHGVTAEIKDLPEIDSKDAEIKMKTSAFSFSRIGFTRPDVKSPEGEVSLSNVNMSLSKGNVEVERPATDVTVPMKDAEQKGRSKFGSPTKFKLPSINLPKFGLKGPKASVEVSAVNVDAEGPEITLPDAKIKLSAEPLTVDIKEPDGDKELKPQILEKNDEDIQFKEKGSKFKLPKFDIGLPEIKGPKFGLSSDKAEIDISVPKGKVEVHPSDAEVQGVTAEIKANLPEADSKDTEIKMKTPSVSFPRIGFSKYEVKIPGGDEIDKTATDVTVPMEDETQKSQSKFGSPTKFKLPSFNLPKFGLKSPKASIVADVDVDLKGPEISLPDTEMKISAEPLTADINGPDVDKELKPHGFERKDEDIQNKEQGSKFKLPKFGIGLPEIKAPKFYVSSEKAEIDISVPKAMVEVHPPEVEVQAVTTKIEADLPNMDSEDNEIKITTPGFSFSRNGFSKPEVEASEGADVPLPEVNVEIERPAIDVIVPMKDAEQKGQSSFASPSKIKLPSNTLPKFGIKDPKASIEISDMDINVKGPEISLVDADIKLSSEPLTVGVKGPDADKEIIPHSLEIKNQNIQIKEQRSTVKLPKFAVNVDVSSPEGNVEIEKPPTDVTIPVEVAEQKGQAKFGSPTKFKLPSINLPKFGIKGPKTSVDVSIVDVDVKRLETSLPDTEMKAEPLTMDIKGTNSDKEIKPPSLEMKDRGIQIKENVSKFKLPKFEIGLPEIKGPKFESSSDKAEVEISLPSAKLEVHPPEDEVQAVTAEIKADLPDMDSKETEIKMKRPGFSFSRIGFSKAEVKAPEGEASLPNTDMSLPEGNVEIEKPATDVSIPVKDAEQKGRSKFRSPTKFKLPSINLPKFGLKGPKASAEVIDVDVDVKRPEISLPDAEIKLSAEPPTVDNKMPDTDKAIKPPSLEIKDQDLQRKEKGSKFKLPKFEIGLPEIKGPKFDISSDKAELDISEPKGSIEVHPPDVEMQGVTADIKAGLSDIDSKDLEMKIKTPSFSFPNIGFSKSEVQASENNSSLPHTDMTLPEGSVELARPASDVTIPMDDAEQKGRLKFGSPTKFKLPSITLPKFGMKGPKASGEVSDVDVDVDVHVKVKGPKINLPDAEVELSAEPLTLDIKGPDADKEMKPPSLEMKDQEIQIKDKGSKFKLPKFGFSLPEVKGPKLDVISDNAEVDSSVAKAMVDVRPPDVKVQEMQNVQHVTAEVKSDLPEVDVINSQVGKCQNLDTVVNDNPLVVIIETNQKHTPGAETSSKFILPTLGDVFRGFEVEFNVPKFDEIEGAMKKYSDPLKHENNIAISGQESTSPAKDSQLLKEVHSPQGDKNQIEFKKVFPREIDEETVSPTLSISSSDAFADVSSALTTEQIGPSLSSPTKVKVKYSEPTSNAEVSDIHGDIITSTARTELITMEPHQPEKVNIPFSSETSSSSLDTLKQMSGHIVVSNVQSVSKTERAAILTKVDTQNIQILPQEKVGESVLSVEETIIRTGHSIVEKHVVKEIFGDDEEKIFVTQRIQVFEGDPSEPISDDTASSIQKLRDTVHTEKIRFFEGAESSQVQTVITSTETLLRHADSSTDENEGK